MADGRCVCEGPRGRRLIIDWLPEANRNRIEQLDYIAEDSPLAAAANAPRVTALADKGAMRPAKPCLGAIIALMHPPC